jgi:hypothetical protein
MDELNINQIAFCENYLRGLTDKKISVVEAYVNAYPDTTRESAYSSSSQLMDQENIKAYLKDRMQSMVMGTNDVLLRLANIAQYAEKDSDKLRALELIGRTLAMFLDRTDITSKGGSISLADYLKTVVHAKDMGNSNATVLDIES